MMPSSSALKGIAIATLILFPPVCPAKASESYHNTTIRLVVPAAPGGGYDAYARMITRALRKHIPGNPNVVLQNMPGAGGLTAANHLYAVAPKDGTVIGFMLNMVPFQPLFGNKLALFDAAKFGWLGTPTTETGVYVTYRTSRIKTLADAQQYEMTVGSLGGTSTQAFYGRVFNDVLGFKARIVSGYPSSNDIHLAMERGELDAHSAPYWSSLKTARPDWYSKKEANFLLQYGSKPHPELKHVPFAPDHAKTADDRSLLIAASAPLALGRVLTAPPGIPSDRLDILRKSFVAAMQDPEIIALCESQRIECDDVRNGSEVEATVRQVYDMPPAQRQRLLQIYTGTSSQ